MPAMASQCCHNLFSQFSLRQLAHPAPDTSSVGRGAKLGAESLHTARRLLAARRLAWNHPAGIPILPAQRPRCWSAAARL